jgi:hypothetical protein
MKKLMLMSFAFVLFVSLSAMAQYGGTQDPAKQDTTKADKASTKATSLSAKVSDDGKTLTGDKDGKSYTVSNPEVLKGHEGHDVIVKGHIDTAKNEIHVTSVKMGKENMKESGTKPDEMKK